MFSRSAPAPKTTSHIRKGMMFISRLPAVKLPRMSLHEYFFSETAKYKNATAFVDYETKEEMTYSDIRESAELIALALVNMGIEKGEVITVGLDNRPEAIYITLGASMAGAVTTPVSPYYPAEEIHHQVENSFTRFAFVVPRGINALRTVFDKCRRDYRLIVVGSREESQGYPILSDLLISVDKSLPLSIEIYPDEDVVYLPFSSGIHGDRKGILTTHSVFCAQLAIANHPLYDNPRQCDTTVPLLPFSRHLGLLCCLTALINGAKLVTVSDFHIPAFIACIEQHQCRIIFTSPRVMQLFVQDDSKAKLDCLQTVIIGTAPVTRKTHESFVARFPSARIASMYSMTETGILARSRPRKTYSNGIGLIAGNIQIKVLDMLSGEELAEHGTGVLYVAGASTSAPYLDNPVEDPVGGWRKTGDIGFIDEEGCVHLIDRAKEMIKVHGVQVVPKELEEMLCMHHAVQEAAVVGVRDHEAGERPVAYVVLRPFEVATKEELLSYVNDRVSLHKKLHNIEVVSSLPRTSCGAILRRVLSDAASSASQDHHYSNKFEPRDPRDL